MNVLFICKHNEGRSQIAEALFNHLSKKHSAISAGTEAVEADEPLPEATILCMKEIGIDLTRQHRRKLTIRMFNEADKVVVIMEKDTCPDYVKNSQKVIY